MQLCGRHVPPSAGHAFPQHALGRGTVLPVLVPQHTSPAAAAIPPQTVDERVLRDHGRVGGVFLRRRIRCAVAQQEQLVAAPPAPSDSPQSSPGLPWWERETAPNMLNIHSVQHLVDEMAKAGDRLVIIDFYAEYCNACKALYPKLVRLMQQHQDNVVCLKINLEENRDIARALNIKVMPYFLFYRGAEGKVDQFSCTISKIARFKDALEQHSGAFCSLSAPPGLEEFPDVKPSKHVDEYEMTGRAENENMPTDVRSLWWHALDD